MIFLVGYQANGRIVGVASAADRASAEAMLLDHDDFIEVSVPPPDKAYVDVSVSPPVVREAVDADIVFDGTTLMNVPCPSELVCDGGYTYRVEAGDTLITFDEPGAHWLRLYPDEAVYLCWYWRGTTL